MGLSPRKGGDALHKVKDRLRWSPFFGKYRLDNLAGFGFREAALAQELGAVLLVSGDDAFTGGAYAGNERCGRGVGEVCKRRGGFVGEALGGELE